jgi:phosphatidylinositol 3-kinase
MKYRDLGHDAQLALTVWEVREGVPRRVLGGATLPLFSKKGRLKTGPQDLQLWLGRAADWGWPTSTPGKVPMAQRGELG